MAGANSPWDNIFSGQIDLGLAQMETAFREKPSPSHLMQLGVAYLWIKDYLAAQLHFGDAIQTNPQDIDAFYKLCGAAMWCQGLPSQAVCQWKAGLTAGYADAAGGAGIPLLLYFASVMRKDPELEAIAREKLEERADDPRVRHWPGPIAQFLIQRIDEHELRGKCTCHTERGTAISNWTASFYIAVNEFAHAKGAAGRYSEAMKDLVLVPRDYKGSYLLGKIWGAEFFLARHEAATSSELSK